jgi:hypothetical protein
MGLTLAAVVLSVLAVLAEGLIVGAAAAAEMIYNLLLLAVDGPEPVLPYGDAPRR